MLDRSQLRRAGLHPLIVIALLCAAVFGWGLRYKLSLYRTAPIGVQHISSAKLLSQDERPQVSKGVTAGRRQAVWPVQGMVAVFGAALMLLAQSYAPRTLGAPALVRRRTVLWYPALFFRPPPSAPSFVPSL